MLMFKCELCGELIGPNDVKKYAKLDYHNIARSETQNLYMTKNMMYALHASRRSSRRMR